MADNKKYRMYPSQIAAREKWDAANTERIQLKVRKGTKAEIKIAADEAGESLTGYIVEATKRRIEQEKFTT